MQTHLHIERLFEDIETDWTDERLFKLIEHVNIDLIIIILIFEQTRLADYLEHIQLWTSNDTTLPLIFLSTMSYLLNPLKVAI